MKNRNLLIFFTLFFQLFLINKTVEAALNINATPLNSGNDIRFSRIEVEGLTSEQVKIRVISTDGKPYQVFQRLADPLINEEGQPIGQRAIQTYSLSSSNSFGTLYGDYPENLNSAEQLIYSSSPTGESDSFNVVYDVNYQSLGGSGVFRGRIIYTVRAIGGSSPSSSFLNIQVEGSDEFTVNVRGSSSIDGTKIIYDDGKIENGHVNIEFTGNPGEKIKVYHQLTTMPQNDLLQEINQNAAMIKTADGQGKIPSGELLSRNKVLLYEFEESDADADIVYTFNEDEMQYQKAGIFRGASKLIIERGGETEERIIDLEFEVKPVFRLEVELPEKGIDFEKLLPNSPPQEHELNVTVKSNLGEPYIVTQNVVSALTNAEGDVIPEKYFTIKMVPIELNGGKVVNEEYVPVLAGQNPIFFSDKKGSPAVFKVLYRLKSFPAIKPGDYSTGITYSLGAK
jgi:hypothetical protein